MRIYDVAFYASGFFILGVLLTSLSFGFIIIILIAVLFAVLFLFSGYLKNKPYFFWLAGLSTVIIIGAGYYFYYSQYQEVKLNINFNQEINFQGIVSDYPRYGNQQQLVIGLQPPYAGKILVKLQAYPQFKYGDLINFRGVIKKPEPIEYNQYLSKDGIFGVSNFPQTQLVAENKGSRARALLFQLKTNVITIFQKTLPAENASFLSGITLGERSEFSKEFKEAMSKSGTTHLVALSGYNISIIVWAAMGLFCWFVSRRSAFILSIIVVAGFVLMAGAEASVVRAAIMGVIILLAQQIGRQHSVRNVIAVTAFLMILANPKILRLDVGFQLSFLALLGIIYVLPAMQNFFRVKKEPGILAWRENLWTSFSAQLAVAPFLIIYFGNFSLTSLLANVLILTLTPLAMALGFMLGFLGFFSLSMAMVLGWLVNLLLSYQVFVIKFFGQLNIFEIHTFGIFLAIAYYAILLIFVFRNYNRQPRFPYKFNT